MIYVYAVSVIKEGQSEKYLEIAKEMAEKSRKETGNVNYDVCQSLENPLEFAMFERWESLEALQAHEQTPHFLELVPKMRELRNSSQVHKYQQQI